MWTSASTEMPHRLGPHSLEFTARAAATMSEQMFIWLELHFLSGPLLSNGRPCITSLDQSAVEVNGRIDVWSKRDCAGCRSDGVTK